MFQAVVQVVQERWVLPYCTQCSRPCCRLDTLVLEFTWRQFRMLWGIRTPRKDFDARLTQGRGPREVRTQDGFYYVHGKPCPAYRDGLCGVYDTDLKPAGCTDFPLYLDDRGALVADLRCEALSVERVEAELRALQPAARGGHSRRVDREFPFLVSFLPAPARQRAPRSEPRRPRPGGERP